MSYDLSIIIAHYYSANDNKKNPLHKTLSIIKEQAINHNVEIIIADDGSGYSDSIVSHYSHKINIKNDGRDIFYIEKEHLKNFLNKYSLQNRSINKWVYLPKLKKCMSKARVTNHAVNLSNAQNILLLDDDNYFISSNSIKNILDLMKDYNFVIGQIKDNNNRLRKYTSNRVQGTTICLNKNIFDNIGGLGEWTEEFSCGVDSDLWFKIYSYFKKNKNMKACYTNKFSTYDSFSKRWKKYTKFLQDINLKRKFYKLYNCKNYKSARYNKSRNKSLWIKNLIDE